jgi:hypothetical protein
MNEKRWIFSEIDIVSEFKFDKNLEKFYEAGVEGLVRENIQNSIDHPINSGEKVTVKINIGKISKLKIPGFTELKDHILSLKGRNEYDVQTVDFMKKSIEDGDIVDYISFEDENTTGLTGADDIDKDYTSYRAYAYEKGSSYENEELDYVRGGSHGIGKIASNSASIINLMFFSNCDEKLNKHTGGTIQLFDHKISGTGYRGTGYFTQFENSKLIPFQSELFDSLFSKETRGLKIIIPFISHEYLDVRKIKQAAIDSFLLAILNNKLEVIINDEKIDSSNIEDFINSDLFEEYPQVKDSFYTACYYKTLKYVKDENLIITDKLNNKYSFKLFMLEDDNFKYAKFGIFRNVGMKIEDFQVKSYLSKPFNGVLIPNNYETDQWLKSLENEAHSKLTHEHIKKFQDKENANRFINNLHRILAEIMLSILEEDLENVNDFDTSDVLYDFDRDFKRDVSKFMKPVLGNSETNKQKTTKTTSGDKKESKGKKEEDNPSKEKKKRKKRNIAGINDNSRNFYYLEHNEVKRISTETEDLFYLNVSNIPFQNSKKINVVLSLVDGEGSEKITEVRLKDTIESAYDEKHKVKLSFNDYQINDVIFDNGVAHFKLTHKNKEFDTNKYFIYAETN